VISLYLLTAHLIGDFPLQPDWMAAEKLDSRSVRARHVIRYSLPFIPLLALTSPLNGLTFIVSNGVVHYLVDSRRWAEPKDHWSPPEMWVWFIDQIIHLTQITVLGIVVFGF